MRGENIGMGKKWKYEGKHRDELKKDQNKAGKKTKIRCKNTGMRAEKYQNEVEKFQKEAEKPKKRGGSELFPSHKEK